jgi:hypothetical protein
MSLSISVACGPFWKRVKSMTLMPSSGAGMAVDPIRRVPPPSRLIGVSLHPAPIGD